jgi:hypothetical protein
MPHLQRVKDGLLATFELRLAFLDESPNAFFFVLARKTQRE